MYRAPKLHPEVTRIHKQIEKNNPKLKSEYSLRIAKAIQVNSKIYGINQRVLTAILMQESAYKVDAKNIKCGISINTGKRDCIVVDYGMAQINHRTVKQFKFDKKLLLSDVEYAVEAAAKVLSNFKKAYGQKEKEYWTRYNASNPEKRKIYKRYVARYL